MTHRMADFHGGPLDGERRMMHIHTETARHVETPPLDLSVDPVNIPVRVERPIHFYLRQEDGSFSYRGTTA